MGGVVLPLFGGYAVAADWSLSHTMLAIAAAPLLVAVAVLFLPSNPQSDP
jgi:hypothetical protein